MKSHILPKTYEEFLELASDTAMKNIVANTENEVTENKLWHLYHKFDIRAPYSNYSYGTGHKNSFPNILAQISDYTRRLAPENTEKIRIRNYVEKILKSDDYKQIGPAMDHFGFFIYFCNFEDHDFMKTLFDFMVNEKVPDEYRILMYQRAVMVFYSSKTCKQLRGELETSTSCSKIRKKICKYYEKNPSHSTAVFMKAVLDEYKSD